MSEEEQKPASFEFAIRNQFSEQMQLLAKKFEVRAAKAITYRNLLIAGTVAMGILVLAPLAWFAATAAVSLVVVGVAILALVAGSYYAKIHLPLWIKKGHDRVKMEMLKQANQQKENIQVEMNRALAAAKTQARANPIEQLQNFLFEKGNRLVSFKLAVNQIGGQVKTMADMLYERQAAKPSKDFSKKREALAAMTVAFADLKMIAKQGDIAIDELREVIEDQKFDWKFAQVGQSAMHNLKVMNGQDLLNEVLAGESFDEVRENFNKVFSEIEMEIENLNSRKSMAFGKGSNGLILDLSGIRPDETSGTPKGKAAE